MQNEDRTTLVDALRGLAAIFVAVFHFNEPHPVLNDIYHTIVKQGWLGVPIFFVISGYCISSTREKSGLVEFWGRRLLRIYPAYWASIIVVLAVVALRVFDTGINDVTGLPKGSRELIFTILGLTAPASDVPGMNWAYWSLGYELAFYIIVGGCFSRRFVLPLAAFTVLSVFVRQYPFDHWGLFAFGIAVKYYLERNYAASCIIAVLSGAQTLNCLSITEAFVGVGTGLLIIWPPRWVCGFVCSLFARVGAFSYSLYLIHVPIGCYFLPFYFPVHFDRTLWDSIFQDCVFLAVSLLFSYGFYILVEGPSHRFAKACFRNAGRAPLDRRVT